MRRNPNVSTALLAASLAVLLGLPTAAARADGSEAPSGLEEMRQTIQAMRTVGTAMFSWYVDEFEAPPVAEAAGTTVDLAAIPPITKEELESLLVPDYLSELPAEDGWGRPLELRLAREPRGRNMMAVRSAGPDGELASGVYELGSFDRGDATADVVWIDGFFARWPE